MPIFPTSCMTIVLSSDIDLDPDDLLVLQGRKDTIQHTCPGPAIRV